MCVVDVFQRDRTVLPSYVCVCVQLSDRHRDRGTPVFSGPFMRVTFEPTKACFGAENHSECISICETTSCAGAVESSGFPVFTGCRWVSVNDPSVPTRGEGGCL